MIKQTVPVGIAGVLVAFAGWLALKNRMPAGPVILSLSAVPLLAVSVTKRPVKAILPDIVFGAIDTGMLTLPALFGGIFYGVAGAITGGVVGDAITDAIAGFFEGGIARRLRNKGIPESREPVGTALGKMTGCLLGSGAVLSVALAFGLKPEFV